jgi:hypothetical protein
MQRARSSINSRVIENRRNEPAAYRRYGRIVSPKELKLMKELAAAGRQGRTVPAINRSGLARMIEKRYVERHLIGGYGVRYVITHRGRQALADKMKTGGHV